MKTRFKTKIVHFVFLLGFLFLCNTGKSQDDLYPINILDQNFSIYANESLSDVVKRFCEYFNLDYSYNSKLIEGKHVNLNVSNKPVRYILEQLNEMYNLIFNLEDDILIIREYVPLSESRRYERQTNLSPPKNRFSFENPKTNLVVIPFKSASNLIIIPVSINNSDTLNFILDTGMRVPMITEIPFVNQLALNYMKPVTIKGLGTGETLTAYRSSDNIMRIPGLISYDQEIHMVIDDNFQISQVLGIPVHGVIGFDLFKDFVVEINYLSHELVITKPTKYKSKIQNKDIILPIHFENDKPFVRTTIMNEKHELVSVKLLVDTGASDALWLSTTSDERINIPDIHIDTYLGKGLSGDFYGKKGRIGGIWMGPIVLNEPIVSFPDSLSLNQVIKNDRNGTLGGEILRRFYVTIDYPGKQIRLRPTIRVKEEFNHNMSGLDISNPIPGFPIFTVEKVRKDSPAYHAGLMENDQIISINKSSTMTLNDINLLLQSRPNRRINLIVLRDGQEISADFNLQPIF